MTNRLFNFIGGDAGSWQVIRQATVAGPPLERVARLSVVQGRLDALPDGSKWNLRGVTSHEHYVTRPEQELLVARQPALGRPEATRAALIPIAKSAAWWRLPQDERRRIFETQSHHIETGLKYLPAVARRLHHGYDLGEPFDFLTWFEFAPAAADAFEELVGILRRSEEWNYVEREIDIRLARVE